MDISSLTCPVCYESFDQKEHLPKILLVCGHTVCSYCLSQLLKPANNRCPFDKKNIGKKKAVKDFPLNYALVQMLEKKLDEKICQKHNKNLSFVCFTEKLKLCYDCMSESNHKKHKVKALDDLQLKTIPQKKELKGLLTYCESNHGNIHQILEEGRTNSLECIRSNFEEIKNQLYRKKLELAFEVNSFYDSRLKKINQNEETNLELRDSIQAKIKTLTAFSQEIDPFKSEKCFNETQKFIRECKSKLKIYKINQEVKSVSEDIEENLKIFTAASRMQTKPLMELKFPCSDNLEKLLTLVSSDNRMEEIPNNDLGMLKASTTLQIKQDPTDTGILTILHEDPNMNEVSLDLEELKNVHTVYVEIKKEITATRDLEVLNYIWKQLGSVRSIKLKLESGPFSSSLFQIFSRGLKNCTEIEINLEGYKEQNEPILPVLKKILKKGNFKVVSLNLSKTKLAWNALDKNIITEMFAQTEIEELDLQVNWTYIPADYIVGLSFPNSVKKLALDFSSTNISNKAFGTMIRSALGSPPDLQDIVLQFHNTSLTDEDLDNITIRSKILRKFFIDIGKTAITNKAIGFLAKTLTFCANTIEDLILGFGGTKITDESLTPLALKMPKLSTLYCHLTAAEITDKAVELLVDNLIAPSTTLENLKLWLGWTEITNVSLRKISEKLERITNLELSLEETLITDEGVIPLIREILPAKEGLKQLKLDISGPTVSENVQNEAREFMKNY